MSSNDDASRIASVSNKRFVLSGEFLVLCSLLLFSCFFKTLFIVLGRTSRSWASFFAFTIFFCYWMAQFVDVAPQHWVCGTVALLCSWAAIGSSAAALMNGRSGAAECRCRLGFLGMWHRGASNMVPWCFRLLLPKFLHSTPFYILCTCNEIRTAICHAFLIFNSLM